MSFIWTDSFDPYAAAADAYAAYWDSGNAFITFVAGRFSGQAVSFSANTASPALLKSSSQNDTVHHIVCAFRQTAALTGTTLGLAFELQDAATTQCSVVFRSDGAILLAAGRPNGTVLATYASAISLQNQWFAFEIEVIVSNTVGGMRVRRNGSTSNDYDSFVSLGNLDTAQTANNYANRLYLGNYQSVSAQHLDDLLWRSDASSVPWVGDVRSYVRAPASDVSTQFSRVGAVTVQPGTTGGALSPVTNQAYYAAFTPTMSGTLSSVNLIMRATMTGNVKCAIYTDDVSTHQPKTLIQGATAALVNPATGSNFFTFTPAVSLVAGAQYWMAFCADNASTSAWSILSGVAASYYWTVGNGSTYAAFPSSTPAGPFSNSGGSTPVFAYQFASSSNFGLVNEPQQDGATSYVYSSNVGDADFYGIAPIAVTPASVVAVTTRGFVQKSDAGSRSGGVQLKSGSSTVQGVGVLSTTWSWQFRCDQLNPATGAAWTPTEVNNVQIGPICSA